MNQNGQGGAPNQQALAAFAMMNGMDMKDLVGYKMINDQVKKNGAANANNPAPVQPVNLQSANPNSKPKSAAESETAAQDFGSSLTSSKGPKVGLYIALATSLLFAAILIYCIIYK